MDFISDDDCWLSFCSLHENMEELFFLAEEYVMEWFIDDLGVFGVVKLVALLWLALKDNERFDGGG